MSNLVVKMVPHALCHLKKAKSFNEILTHLASS